MPLPAFLAPYQDVPLGPVAAAGGEPAVEGEAANPLPFIMQSQQYDEWCWAAMSASVSAFFDPATPWTQCKVASSCLPFACCGAPMPTPCNQPHDLDNALTETGNLAAPATGGCLLFDEVVTQINLGRPVCCHISWSGGGAHVIAIYGYDAATGDVDIGDPCPTGPKMLPYQTVVESYPDGGAWDDSYLTS